MKIPRFTAESSLYQASGHYYGAMAPAPAPAHAQVATPQEFSPLGSLGIGPTPAFISCFPCHLDETGACVQDCTRCLPGHVDGCQDFYAGLCTQRVLPARAGRLLRHAQAPVLLSAWAVVLPPGDKLVLPGAMLLRPLLRRYRKLLHASRSPGGLLPGRSRLHLRRLLPYRAGLQ
jgi:hypothetical protein